MQCVCVCVLCVWCKFCLREIFTIYIICRMCSWTNLLLYNKETARQIHCVCVCEYHWMQFQDGFFVGRSFGSSFGWSVGRLVSKLIGEWGDSLHHHWLVCHGLFSVVTKKLLRLCAVHHKLLVLFTDHQSSCF